MKKLIIVFALVFVAGATVFAFENNDKEKREKKRAKKEVSCCSKEMEKECTKEMRETAKKDSKSCCEKKAGE